VQMLRIPYDELAAEFDRVLRAAGFAEDRAATLAEIFAANTRDGVPSHGVDRFPYFVGHVQQGRVDPAAEPARAAAFGAWEQWDGRGGPGPLNAIACTDRACALADAHGVGCVALRNTTHWMRPGAYGWRAALKGYVFLCWTNTGANMPPWGARERRVGNNPLVLAVPRGEEPVVLDMAVSQFAGGKLAIYRRRGEPLPVPGGYDEAGRLTTDAEAIARSGRALPAGYWKGSALALLLDLTAALLSGGLATHEIERAGAERSVSQVFIAFEALRTLGTQRVQGLVDEALAYLLAAEPAEEGGPVRYPGQGVLAARRDSEAHGVPVDASVWETVRGL